MSIILCFIFTLTPVSLRRAKDNVFKEKRESFPDKFIRWKKINKSLSVFHHLKASVQTIYPLNRCNI